jgi:hypothetical protein
MLLVPADALFPFNAKTAGPSQGHDLVTCPIVDAAFVAWVGWIMTRSTGLQALQTS